VTSERPPTTNFEEAAQQVASRIAMSDVPNLEILRQRLTAYLGHRFRNALDESERHDAVEEALASFTDAVAGGAVQVKTAPAYLLTIARHKAVDAVRRRRRWNAELQDEAPELPVSDETERLVDREVARDAVRAALRDLVSSSAVEDVRILMTWLDLSEEYEHGPSARRVASEAGVSHTSVNRTLARLRDRLAPYVRED
jgi:RNA polymerase sigma factor (sigma-70 family)